jgi:glycosyltransferase involved in cell wall biosynthesis
MSPTSNTPTRPDVDPRGRPLRLSGLTIVLPCFNEAAKLPDAVRLATDAAERCALKHEIVVVDDGSSDETATVATELVIRDARARLLIHPHNRGYGQALRSGIADARSPWMLLIDADLQFVFGELEDFLALTPSADLVVGWRILPQGPVGRRAGSALWNRFVRAALHLPQRDVPVHHRTRIAGRQVGAGRRLDARTLRELVDLRRTPRDGPPRPLGV